MNGALYQTFSQVGQPAILVVGDPILDQYVWGKATRISPEAPIPVLLQSGQEFKAGGAGSVAFNLLQLEAHVTFCGSVGDDAEADILRDIFAPCPVELSGLISEPGRITSLKTRFMARVQQMLRVDREVTRPISPESEKRIEDFVLGQIPGMDLVIVSDYDKGVTTPGLMRNLVQECRSAGVPCIADPARLNDYTKYDGFTLISPNRAEAEAAAGIAITDEASLHEAGRRLLDNFHLEHVAITRDRDGISLFSRDDRVFHDSAQVRDVYDVTGAGDMVTSVLGLVLAAGKCIEDAVRLANIAAGIEVGKLGVAPVSRKEIREAILGQTPVQKLRTLEELLPLLANHRAENRQIVFTNGCFDILHQGHIESLHSAKSFGDILVIGLNSDRSVRDFKGPQRPILRENERAMILSALTAVDYLVLFDEPTPLHLIEAIRPDVLAKGADYKKEEVVGHDVVERYGGRVELIPLVDGISTTDIVTRILEQHQGHTARQEKQK